MNIAQLAIKRPAFVVMIVLAIITLGLMGYMNMPIDLMPKVDYPVIGISSIYPGASAEEIETIFTKPLENELATVEGLDELSSTSREGYSIVVLQFKMETDIKSIELKVREKVQALKQNFPQDAADPVIQRFSTSDTPIQYLSLSGNMSQSQLRDVFDDKVKPVMEAQPGVGTVDVFGSRKKRIQLTVNRALLSANGISYTQLVNAVQLRNLSFPVGSIHEDKKNTTIRVTGKSDNLEDIKKITLTTLTGKLVRISDISKVEETLEDEESRSRVNGKPALLFAIYKQSGANTVAVANGVRKAAEDIKPNLPTGIELKVVSDNSTMISRSIKGVQDDIFTGIILAIIIVFLFLGNVRSTIITAIALPNSLLGAFFLIKNAGFSINTVSLMALSLAVGLLIDDSIVVRENIFRHIEEGEDPKTAAEKGTNEVALAVLSTTLSIMAVFIPISFLSGIVGAFFREFGLTVAFALMISLLDAFTTAPMLSAYWYSDSKKNTKTRIGKFINQIAERWETIYKSLNKTYTRLLEWSLNHKKTVLFSTAGLLLASILSLTMVGQNFLSPVDAGNFTVTLETYPGAPLNNIDGVVHDIENFIASQKGIEDYYSVIGDGASHKARISVDLVELKKRKISTGKMADLTREFIRSHYESVLTYRVAERSAIDSILGSGSTTGISAALMISIKGPDLKVLEGLSRDVYKAVANTPGTMDVAQSLKPGTPEMVLRLDAVKAEKAGITVAELGTILRDLVQGARISTITLNEKDYDIYLRLSDDVIKTRSDIRNLIITTRTGRKIPVSAVCDIEYSSSPQEINRDAKQRLVRVSANLLPGYALADIVSSTRKNIQSSVEFPAGYTFEYSGQQKYFNDMGKQMALAMLLAVLFMYMILTSLYNSFIQPLYIMISLPLAFIGAFFTLFLTGISLDVFGYIGLIMVLGLVAKNAILLLDFANKKREEGLSVRQSLLAAAPVRLRPILMTSFAIVFGMLPLALGLNEGSSGRQALPMTVIGGIITSTFLTLVVVPIVYEWAENLAEKVTKGRRHPHG